MKSLIKLLSLFAISLCLVSCKNSISPSNSGDKPQGDEAVFHIVTYLDESRKQINQVEVEDQNFAPYLDITLNNPGYDYYWAKDDGQRYDFFTPVTEDLTLMINHKLYGSALFFSEEILDEVKKPCPVNFNPGDEYKANYRYFAMNAGFDITDGGRIWSVWIAGEDGSGAYLVAAYSDDDGQTFSDIQFVIDPHRDDLPMVMNTHVAGVWKDPDGNIFVFYQQSFGMWDGAAANFAIKCENPDDEHPVWSEPFYVSPGASIKKPIVCSNGEWLLPVSIWERWHITTPLEDCHHELDNIRGATVYVSKDKGATWSYRGGLAFIDSSFNEHSIVELSDQRIMMISRCSTGIKKSYSSDWGKTWSSEQLAFNHVNSMAAMRKLSDGRLVLVKHGASMTSATSARSNLTVFISDDDGVSWKGGLEIDARTGISYPDIAFHGDYIYVQYDYNRTTNANIIIAKFNANDIINKSISSSGGRLLIMVKNTTGIAGHEYSYGAVSASLTGNGTSENPYLISCPEDFRYLAESVFNGNTYNGKYFKQTSDLDFENTLVQPVGAYLQGGSWKPAFMGTYDGNNHVIKNARIEGRSVYCRALFGYITKGGVFDLTAENVKIVGESNSGIFVGLAEPGASDSVTISNCVAESSCEVIGYWQIGGIVGRARNNTVISDCINYANVTIPYANMGNEVFAAGIAGYFENNAGISDCKNYGKITVKSGVNISIGGITGTNKACSISYTANYGDVEVINACGNVQIGGISGWTALSVVGNYVANEGNVTAGGLGNIFIGGLYGIFGKDNYDGNTLSYAYSTGNVKVTLSSHQSIINCGGLIGYLAAKTAGMSGTQISDCACTGEVTNLASSKVSYCGSFAGYVSNIGIVFAHNACEREKVLGIQMSIEDGIMVDKELCSSIIDEVRSKI